MNPNTKTNFQSLLANKYVQIGGIAFIVINMLLLNVFVFIASRQTSATSSASGLQKNITAQVNLSAGQASQQSICASCEAKLDQALTTIKDIQNALSAAPKNTTANPTPIPTLAPTIVPAATAIPTPAPTQWPQPSPRPQHQP
jgi:hypothetical protein